MAKRRTSHVCEGCGTRTSKWVGKCAGCGEWGTVIEEIEIKPPPGRGAAFGAIKASGPKRLIEVKGTDVARRSTQFGELDRVLGGGLVAGSLILVGGDPGIGKSTLLLQAADKLAQTEPVLYVTGEESPRQTRMRFERIGATATDLWLVAETSIEKIEAYVAKLKPTVLIVDSIQTLFTQGVPSAPGSIAQLRASTGRLMALAKGREVATFLIGHVTKNGSIAGPRVLEHMVDTVLYFEGRRGHAFRILRAVKNRFGSTDEIGTFEMRSDGLSEVTNPSEIFLAERAAGASGSVVSASFEGTRPILVEVQALVSPTVYGTARRTTMGVDSSRVALLLAVLEKKAELDIAGADVFVNVAGGLRLDEPAGGLPIAIALASSHMDRAVDERTALFGEIGLGGEVRSVIGAEARIAEARQLGFTRIILPSSDAARIKSVEGIELVPVHNIGAALDAVF